MNPREIRHGAGMTMSQLAESAGMTASQLSNFETGKHSVSLGTLYRWAVAVGHTVLAEQLAPIVAVHAERKAGVAA